MCVQGLMVSTGEKVAVKCEPVDVPEKDRLLEQEKVVLNELRGATGVPRVLTRRHTWLTAGNLEQEEEAAHACDKPRLQR
jgi:hypothetical protein